MTKQDETKIKEIAVMRETPLSSQKTRDTAREQQLKAIDTLPETEAYRAHDIQHRDLLDRLEKLETTYRTECIAAYKKTKEKKYPGCSVSHVPKTTYTKRKFEKDVAGNDTMRPDFIETATDENIKTQMKTDLSAFLAAEATPAKKE